MFETEVLKQTVAVARRHKIEPAALLAVVEVESAGRSKDGKYPCLLLERHILYRELSKRSPQKLPIAIQSGLANQVWRPASQYKDQGTTAKRIALFEQAAQIDRECAIRACSWGVGQTMGMLAEELHFKSANEMLDYMMKGGVPAQVECFVREIENKHLTYALNHHQWEIFARRYNGPSYAVNRYDSKIGSAYLKWSKVPLPNEPPEPIPPLPPKPPTPKPKPSVFAGLAAAVTALIAAVWHFMQDHWEIFAFAGFVAVLAIITALVERHHHSEAQRQLGVLGNVVEGGS